MYEPFFLPITETLHQTPHQIRKAFGGKALGLVEAYGLGLKLPPTWFIPCSHFENFKPQVKDFYSEAKEYITKLFEKELLTLPDTLYAVRSSSQSEDKSDHSYAGIFDSQLHILRKDLPSAIARVWNSCHSLKATTYFDEHLKMGVILQPIIEAKYAGVAFSKHPSPSNIFENHHLVIEFSEGSGEKVVQGEITPWRIEGNEEEILSSAPQTWTKELIITLSKLKEFHAYDVDIEFVVTSSGEFYLLQQRPVSRTHPSHLLDLSNYSRKYKRPIYTLDAELLIGGISRFLSAYLELPYQLERLVVMVGSEDGVSELWFNDLLDEAVTSFVIHLIETDRNYLERVEMRHRDKLDLILGYPYPLFFDPHPSLAERFFKWSEFIRPLHAHYYAPMYMNEALYRMLLNIFKKIDPEKAEEDLSFLGTFEIQTLFDLMLSELREINGDEKKLERLRKRYGFLKSREVHHPGYSIQELLDLAQKTPQKSSSTVEEKFRWHALLNKYIKTPKEMFLFEKFREWMRIRNQDMEFIMYAILETRPLFEEIASALNIEIREIWQSSTDLIVKALERLESHFLKQISQDDLVIYYSFGKVRLKSHLIVKNCKLEEGDVAGKKIWGEGSYDGTVVVAFSPEELSDRELPENPILVTGMTTPDFIPYMTRFKALITDEGGILCHASIIARELSLPSVIGTGIATDRFKNGMKVHVDFDRGVITQR